MTGHQGPDAPGPGLLVGDRVLIQSWGFSDLDGERGVLLEDCGQGNWRVWVPLERLLPGYDFVLPASVLGRVGGPLQEGDWVQLRDPSSRFERQARCGLVLGVNPFSAEAFVDTRGLPLARVAVADLRRVWRHAPTGPEVTL